MIWRTDPTGTATVTDDAVREAVVTAYLSNNGFFFPDRFPAAVRYVQTKPAAGRSVDVVDIDAVGGRPFESSSTMKPI